MSTETSESEYPSVDLAYPLAEKSYGWISKRLDVLDTRIDGILKLGVSLTLAAPIAFKALDIQYQLEFFTAAVVVFLPAFILSILARVVGRMKIIDLKPIYDTWIQYPENDFKRYFIYFAGQHLRSNISLLHRRYIILFCSIFLFLAEFVLLGLSVLV